jgi:hypothetical protein
MHAHTLMGCHVTITTNVANNGDEKGSRRISSLWLDVCKFFLKKIFTIVHFYWLFYQLKITKATNTTRTHTHTLIGCHVAIRVTTGIAMATKRVWAPGWMSVSFFKSFSIAHFYWLFYKLRMTKLKQWPHLTTVELKTHQSQISFFLYHFFTNFFYTYRLSLTDCHPSHHHHLTSPMKTKAELETCLMCLEPRKFYFILYFTSTYGLLEPRGIHKDEVGRHGWFSYRVWWHEPQWAGTRTATTTILTTNRAPQVSLNMFFIVLMMIYWQTMNCQHHL